MKLKVLSAITLATLTMSLVGCQPLDDLRHGVKDGAEQKMQENTKLGPKLSKEEYVQSIGDLKREFEEAFKNWGVISNDQENENYVKDNLAEMNKIRAVVDKYKALNAPKEFKEVQNENLKGMALFEKGLDLMAKAFKAKNEETFNKYQKDAMEDLTKGQDHWNYAFALLDVTENIPVGTDGTLFSDDLADLDLNAGIDRSSVITNISKSGKELQGKWGYYNEDGSFNVSLVIKSNGDYEGFAKGTYPETDMKGTWKYDYLKRTIVFEHDKSEYRTLKMDVQSFQDDTVQLMDLDSLNTFQYVKEGSPNPSTDSTKSSSPSVDSSTTSSKPSSNKSSSSSFTTEDQLSGTQWNLDADTWEYRGLSLNEDGTATYSWSLDDKEETYRGIWQLEGNTIVFDVREATENYGDEMSNYPDELTFEIVSYSDKAMKLKFDGNVDNYELYE